MLHTITDPPYIICLVLTLILTALWLFFWAGAVASSALTRRRNERRREGARKEARDSGYPAHVKIESSWFWSLAGIGCVPLVIAAILFIAGLFPLGYDYHHHVLVQGTVTQTGNRLLASGTNGGGSNERFVLTINGTAYGCDDTRCSLLHKGDKVTLLCEKQFQWTGPEGWVCAWGKMGLNG